MLWWVILIEALVFAVLFTTILFVCYHGDRIYRPDCIHNYPSDIQEAYFKTHARGDVSYQSKNVVLAKSMGVLIFTGILFACALIGAGAMKSLVPEKIADKWKGSVCEAVYCVITLILSVAAITANTSNSFIYFQF